MDGSSIITRTDVGNIPNNLVIEKKRVANHFVSDRHFLGE